MLTSQHSSYYVVTSTYVHVVEISFYGGNPIDLLSQCKSFSPRSIICLYGLVGKWIGVITGGNKLLAICQFMWHKYSHNVECILNGAQLYYANNTSR